MIELNCIISKKPVRFKTYTEHKYEAKNVPVIKIRKNSYYEALIFDPDINAPYDRKEHHNGNCWRPFKKKDNKHIRLPVLRDGEEREYL